MSIRYTTTWAAVTLTALLCAGAGLADESKEKLAVPGFRPESKLADEFVQAAPNATIAVFPAIVRTVEGTSYDPAAAERIATYIRKNALGAGETADLEFEPGEAEGIQYRLFKKSMKGIGKQRDNYAGDADYLLVTEYLLSATRSGGMAAGGIQCYILDRSGENAFSFLLNSHHKAFVEAGLRRSDASAESKAWLVDKCTGVAQEALKGQVAAANDE